VWASIGTSYSCGFYLRLILIYKLSITCRIGFVKKKMRIICIYFLRSCFVEK